MENDKPINGDANDGQDMSRRGFLKIMLGGAAILIGGTAFAKTDIFKAGKNSVKKIGAAVDPYNLRQLITADPARSRVIMWQTDAKLDAPQIEYREVGGTSKTVSARDVAFEDDDEKIFQYRVDLTDLAPGKTYEYRLNENDEWHRLLTPADNANFSCLIFPDSQSADYTDWQNIFRAAVAREPNAAFYINMGDLVDNGEANDQWRAWFGAVASASDKIPCAPVMGNHETYNLAWKMRLPHAFLNYFPAPINNSEDFEGYYYSFDYGNAHFSVINNLWDEIDGFRRGILPEQKEWLRRDIAQTSRPWKIVLMHKDVLRYRINGRPERQEGFSDVGTEFMPLFDELGVDIVFTAHLHTYRNRGRLYNFQSAEKGPAYILTGVAGDVRYPDLWINHPLDKFVAPQPETDNYLTLTVAENYLEVKCFLPDGQEIDRCRLEKN